MQINCPAGLRTPPKHLFGTLDTPCTVIGNFTKEMQDYSGFDSTVIFAPSHDTASAVCACRLMITAYIFLQAQVKVPNHGEIEKTQTQGRHEPIVSVEDFDKVQQMLNAKRKTLKNLNT